MTKKKLISEPKKNYLGQIFGRLEVVGVAPEKRSGTYVWLCQCSCGNPKLHPVLGSNLSRTKSCGCLRQEILGQASITHGESGSLRHRMWLKAKCRAKKLQVPCDIDLEDVVIPNQCPVLKINLAKGNQTSQDTSPSLDRIFPELGYVKGNIWVISHRANRIKNDSSLKELKQLIIALEKQEHK